MLSVNFVLWTPETGVLQFESTFYILIAKRVNRYAIAAAHFCLGYETVKIARQPHKAAWFFDKDKSTLLARGNRFPLSTCRTG